MIGTNMDTGQIQMQIETVKDELGRLEFRTKELDKEMKEFYRLTDEIRVQLAELRGKL